MGEKLIRITCGESYHTKIRGDLSRGNREFHKLYDIICPYSPGTFRNIGPLNKHIYIERRCPKIEEILKTKNWNAGWKDMYGGE